MLSQSFKSLNKNNPVFFNRLKGSLLIFCNYSLEEFITHTICVAGEVV